MRVLSWLAVVALVLDAAGLALFELFYLPLHLPPSLGGWWLPVTVLVAATTTPLLVWAAAKVAPKPAVAVAPLAAWLLTILGLGMAGPGGDRVLPDDWKSLLLLLVGMVTGGITVGRLMVGEYLPMEPLSDGSVRQ